MEQGTQHPPRSCQVLQTGARSAGPWCWTRRKAAEDAGAEMKASAWHRAASAHVCRQRGLRAGTWNTDASRRRGFCLLRFVRFFL
ncbi:hypothetical protein AAFF_G00276270 [Aldrovandia affinis]|uniref:Uncharacterized protein n=1 Tax=Aldrovandia affinis TaxID=143900 RepID=A0AAD7RAJ3_9TELE|nr:hypothetical protein AAFF_G00276270 [Aldrovandia affinis]